jgi:hypothetical protein
VRVMVGLQDVGDDRRCCGFSWGTWLIHTSSLFSGSRSTGRGGGVDSRRLPGDGAIEVGRTAAGSAGGGQSGRWLGWSWRTARYNVDNYYCRPVEGGWRALCGVASSPGNGAW